MRLPSISSTEAALNRSAGSRAGGRRPGSSPSSRRTPTDTAPCASRARSRKPAPRGWRLPTSKRASNCARPARARRILVFGALSVSDLDGRLRLRADADDRESGGRPRAADGRRRARRDAALSPEDRHRHASARVSPREPAADAAGTARQREPRARGGATRISRPPTNPSIRSSTTQRVRVREGLRDAATRSARGPRLPPRGQQRGAAPRLARLVRLRPPGPAAVRRGAAAARDRRSRWRR